MDISTLGLYPRTGPRVWFDEGASPEIVGTTSPTSCGDFNEAPSNKLIALNIVGWGR